MEELLGQILAELKYHTKLLESMLEFFDTSNHERLQKQGDLKKTMDGLLSSILDAPGLKGKLEVQELKKKMNLGG